MLLDLRLSQLSLCRWSFLSELMTRRAVASVSKEAETFLNFIWGKFAKLVSCDFVAVLNHTDHLARNLQSSHQIQ